MKNIVEQIQETINLWWNSLDAPVEVTCYMKRAPQLEFEGLEPFILSSKDIENGNYHLDGNLFVRKGR